MDKAKLHRTKQAQADTIPSIVKQPPKIKKHNPYYGNNIAKYNKLFLRLKNYFCQNPEYYMTDLLKIFMVVNKLDNLQLKQ